MGYSVYKQIEVKGDDNLWHAVKYAQSDSSLSECGITIKEYLFDNINPSNLEYSWLDTIMPKDATEEVKNTITEFQDASFFVANYSDLKKWINSIKKTIVNDFKNRVLDNYNDSIVKRLDNITSIVQKEGKSLKKLNKEKDIFTKEFPSTLEYFIEKIQDYWFLKEELIETYTLAKTITPDRYLDINKIRIYFWISW